MFLGSWPSRLWCLKAKNSNSYCSSEGRYRANPKKYGYPAKKVRLGFRGFRTNFWEVDHPLCDVWKQKTQILIAHQKEGIDQTKKSFLVGKKSFLDPARKVQLGFRGFHTWFWEVDHPLCDVWKQKTQTGKKSFLVGKKSFLVCKKSFLDPAKKVS